MITYKLNLKRREEQEWSVVEFQVGTLPCQVREIIYPHPACETRVEVVKEEKKKLKEARDRAGAFSERCNGELEGEGKESEKKLNKGSSKPPIFQYSNRGHELSDGAHCCPPCVVCYDPRKHICFHSNKTINRKQESSAYLYQDDSISISNEDELRVFEDVRNVRGRIR